MATFYDLLLARYQNVARITKVADIPAADLAALQALDAGSASLSAATASLAALTAGTTQVAVQAYQFFTGATPSSAGLDYLVSPEGPNPNNLNSAYYRSFSVENRYINFAVNLGKLGEGKDAFAANYGALTLSDAVTKAYTQIFGHPPDAGKVDAILSAAVPNGLGGTYTRADYFASYGLDGLTGIGTKAAAIGWLLDVALQGESVNGATAYGPYVAALQNYVLDLAIDGQVRFQDNMLAEYGPGGPFLPGGALYQGSPGITVSVGLGQTLNAPSGRNTGLLTAGYSTDGNDVISAPQGLTTQAAIYAGDGNDTITVGGTMAGLVAGGQGNDVINIATLAGTVLIAANEGYDEVNVSDITGLRFDGLGRILVSALPVINTLEAGVDHLNFAGGLGLGVAVTGDLGGATSLDAAVGYVSARTAAGTNAVFEYNGATYAYHQDTVLGVSAGDGLVWIKDMVGFTVGNGTAIADIHFG